MTRRYGIAAATAAVLAMVLGACGAPPVGEPETSPTPEPSSVAPTPAPSASATGPSVSSTSTGASSGTSPTASSPTSATGSAGSGGPSGSAGSSPSGSGDVDLAQHQPETSWQQALGIAREQFDGRPTSIELGWERDGLVYTVELVSQTQEYEAEIAAKDGRLLAESTDALDEDEAKSADGKVIDTPGIIAVTDAMAAATESTPGRVREWKLARNSGGVYYEFDIVADGASDDTEVHVDATSGKVIS